MTIYGIKWPDMSQPVWVPSMDRATVRAWADQTDGVMMTATLTDVRIAVHG